MYTLYQNITSSSLYFLLNFCFICCKYMVCVVFMDACEIDQLKDDCKALQNNTNQRIRGRGPYCHDLGDLRVTYKTGFGLDV
jgi:hypothetical protein